MREKKNITKYCNAIETIDLNGKRFGSETMQIREKKNEYGPLKIF